MPEAIQEQLVKHLTDVHSIEEQALTQMKRAGDLAGESSIGADFDRHLAETERHERMIRERLEAHDASPSKLKDAAGIAGGWGMLAFAKFNPDTPGKLVNHAYSYEHMEIAAYELLGRIAERAGDDETGRAAAEILAEERTMAECLEHDFDAAVAASLRDQDPDDLGDQLDSYLADAHAIEQQSKSLLEGGRRIVGLPQAASLFEDHLAETKEQEQRLEDRLEARGSSSSRIKDLGMRLGGLNAGAFFGAQPDTPAKLVGFAYAFENLEVAGYEQLRRVAERARDGDTALLASDLADQERATATRIAKLWDAAVDAALEAQGVR